MFCNCISKVGVVVRQEERELSLSACCFRNFSLAPEPPGVLEGIAVVCFVSLFGLG